MKTAVLSVVYEEVKPYIADFMNSLQRQIDSNYEIILVNDGYTQLEEFISAYTKQIRILQFNGSFVGIRKQAIYWLAENGFDTVIFADSDDYFDSHRVAITKALLANYDLVCNELLLFGENVPGIINMASPRFSNGQVLTLEHLYNGNIMGMSNTGARLSSILPLIDIIPEDVVAFDWILYSLALLKENTCVFTDKTKTYYRQHANNIASPHNYSEEQIMRGVEVKLYHYQMLSNYLDDYQQYAKEFKQLLKRLKNVEFRNEYCNAVRRNAPQYALWWEGIKLARELNL